MSVRRTGPFKAPDEERELQANAIEAPSVCKIETLAIRANKLERSVIIVSNFPVPVAMRDQARAWCTPARRETDPIWRKRSASASEPETKIRTSTASCIAADRIPLPVTVADSCWHLLLFNRSRLMLITLSCEATGREVPAEAKISRGPIAVVRFGQGATCQPDS